MTPWQLHSETSENKGELQSYESGRGQPLLLVERRLLYLADHGHFDVLRAYDRHRGRGSPTEGESPDPLVGARLCFRYPGTPALVQILVVYYGLVDYGITLGPLTAACAALSANVGAYLSETFRGAILAVPKGQTEAAYASGMSSWQTLRRIIFPQAARVAIAPIGNTFIGMLKETALVSVITVTEMVRSAQLLIAQYFVNMPFYLGIGAMYWVMSTVFSWILGTIEKRLSRAY